MTTYHSETKQLDRADAQQAAVKIWYEMTDNEKSLIRFGMFPRHRMEDEGVADIDGRLLAVALMEIAEAHGGMIA